MKKILLALAILLIANPAWAGLVVEATATECNEVTITYDMDDTDPNRPRAFALEISLDNDANIGPVTYVHSEFHVYPGSIVITGGVVTDQGTPVAESDVSSMIVEMGSLYADTDPCHTEQPAENGVLLVFMVENDKDCNVTLLANAIRGGVVMEDTTQEFSGSYFDFIGCHVDGCPEGCFPPGHDDYAEWLAVGEPDSWCISRQCHGDTDDLKFKVGKYYYYVNYTDLNTFVDGFATEYPESATHADTETYPWISADFNHQLDKVGKFYYRVGYGDLDILVANFASDPDPNCLEVP